MAPPADLDSSSDNDNMPPQVRLIDIVDVTDADPSYVPSSETHTKVDLPVNYLEKLGTMWMIERGEAQKGITYRINKLPDGYTVWEKPRPGQPSHVDKWCFGHPTRKFFDSPNKFFPHFLSLMEEGNAKACICVNCDKKSKSTTARGLRRPKAPATSRPAPSSTTAIPDGWKKLPTRPPSRPPKQASEAVDFVHELTAGPNAVAGVYKAKGRQWVEGRTDEEGTPDPYRNNIDHLKTLGSLDTVIEEPMSMDWRAERASGVDQYFKSIRQRPDWQPRRMEIVLFVRALAPDEQIVFVASTNKYVITNGTDSSKEPLWEAGVVTQTSHGPENITEYSITSSGFRIEPLSNANDKNGKGIWKQYTYVRADQLRPFSLWKNFLTGVGSSQWQPTIANAMLVMSTVTLIKRYRFKGKWPEAKIYCRGMYLGPELIVEGDFVYLLPEGEIKKQVTDIMRIDAITLDMWNLDKSNGNDYDEGHPYNSAARVTGRVYTIDQDRAFDKEPAKLSMMTPQTRLDLFGPWYPRTPADKLARIPFHRILGRCHDPDVVEQWLHGSLPTPDTELLTKPGIALQGVIHGRMYSSEEFRHIDDDRNWFWADTRAEALDLEEINGRMVSSQDPDRDPKKYRKEIRVIEGTARPEERLSLQQAEKRNFSRGGPSGMVASAMDIDEADYSKEASRERKRGHDGLSASDGEDEDEAVLEHNTFVEQMAEGLAMSDEGVPSGSEDEIMSPGRASTQYGTPRSVPMVIIDD